MVKQSVLELKKILKDNKACFSKVIETYVCSYKLSKNFDNSKPVAIIPIRDNLKLLQYTLHNLKVFEVNRHVNIVVVDDRSVEDLTIILDDSYSYFRIDGDNGFNFSMLNNIPAKIFYDLGCKQIVLWNSDLWCMDRQSLPNLISKHEKLNSTITGTKLIYPPLSMSLTGEQDSENIKKMFKSKIGGSWRETVQFGGDFFFNGAFHHYGRFRDPSDYRINCNRPAFFITGAFQIIDLKEFIKLGGLNPSLQKNYQDNDFCLKVMEGGGKIYYIGQGCGFYHDESALLHENKIDKKFTSNQVLFEKIWNNKIMEIL
jgi:GT2 family glycosyltransferase